jgi:hypothetical protein
MRSALKSQHSTTFCPGEIRTKGLVLTALVWPQGWSLPLGVKWPPGWTLPLRSIVHTFVHSKGWTLYIMFRRTKGRYSPIGDNFLPLGSNFTPGGQISQLRTKLKTSLWMFTQTCWHRAEKWHDLETALFDRKKWKKKLLPLKLLTCLWAGLFYVHPT